MFKFSRMLSYFLFWMCQKRVIFLSWSPTCGAGSAVPHWMFQLQCKDLVAILAREQIYFNFHRDWLRNLKKSHVWQLKSARPQIFKLSGLEYWNSNDKFNIGTYSVTHFSICCGINIHMYIPYINNGKFSDMFISS